MPFTLKQMRQKLAHSEFIVNNQNIGHDFVVRWS
jgi:hypothetical protein